MNEAMNTAPTIGIGDVGTIDSDTPRFFAVSPLKLLVMSLCTLFFYQIYWFYRNWQLIKPREEISILPFWRALFGVLWCYPCFERMQGDGNQYAVKPPLPAGVLATGYILFTLASNLPGAFWLLSLFNVYFLIRVQVYVNRINVVVAPKHDQNATFNTLNWVAVIVGGIVLLLAIIGTFLPVPAKPV